MKNKNLTRFIAYNYPGWHFSNYRPNINEWKLIDTFKPYFKDHQPPPKPITGPYNDSNLEVVRKQIALAKDAGIEAFTYFTFYRPSCGFIMEKPMERAFEVTSEIPSFRVTCTWCIRLPHNEFPVLPLDKLEIPEQPRSIEILDLKDTPVEHTTLYDLERLLHQESIDLFEITLYDKYTTEQKKTLEGNISLGKIRYVLKELSDVINSQVNESVPIATVYNILNKVGAEKLPLQTVENLLEAIRNAKYQDILNILTISELEKIISIF